MTSPSPDLSRLTPHALKCYHEGIAQIVKRFGSTVAKSRFGISSDMHVESPTERLDRIADAAAQRAIKNFTTPATPTKAPAPSKAQANRNVTYKFMSISYGERQAARRLARTA